ncbi:MAG: hypothetical protein IT262_13725 [Saprospiraceae bacterium]|nr:hypothetical protein [Saprospiraceae bacterium]
MKKDSNYKGIGIIHSLFRLIKSLSQTQKRDFKKYARFWSSDKEQKYIALFDHINRYIAAQKEMSELATDLSDSKKFGPNASINTLAHYLFDKIMDSIRDTPRVIPSRHDRLFKAFYDIHFLFYKELYAECYKVIREAKRLAHDMDRPVYILELQIWEARITTRLSNVSWKLADMQKELYDALQNIQETYTTFLQAQQLLVAFKTPDGNVSPEIRNLMNAIKDKKEDDLKGLSPRLHYWRLVEVQHYFELQYIIERKSLQADPSQKNLSDGLHQLKENLDFLSENGKIIAEEEPVIYYSTLENYLSKCLELKDTEGIKKLESAFIDNNDKKNEIHLYRSISHYRLLSYIRFNQFNEACLYIENQDLENNLQTRQHLISDNRMSIIRYGCVQAYFLNTNYKTALEWINRILNNPRSQSVPIAFQMSEMLQVICLIQIEPARNSTLLIDPLIRRCKRREPKNKFLHDLLLSLRYAAMQQQGATEKATLKQRNKLNAYLDKNKTLYVYGPVLAWIDSRISGKSLAEEIITYNS